MPEVHQHDKGYKELYSNKTVFLDFLRNILKLDWAKQAEPEDLTLVNKSYITGDFSELESDLVYQMKLDGQEIILYVLMEFQSTVDYRMPVRLLFYMTEILREYLKEKNYSAGDTKVRIPAIFPIVFYNGNAEWKAACSLREITEGGELCGENLLNLRYALVDVNHQYTEEELLENDCVSSIVLLLDQHGELPTVLKRLGEIVSRFKSLHEGQNRQIIEQWIRHSGNPKISGNMVEILQADKEEVHKMVSNLARLWDEDIKEAAAKAAEQATEIARAEGERKAKQARLEERMAIIRALSEQGMTLEFISHTTKEPISEIKKILQMPS